MEENAPLNLETSFCYPAHIAIDFFRSMLNNREIDYFFIPHVKELYVPGGITRRDFCSTCNFSRGEAFYIRRICHEHQDRILAPSISFNGGWENGLKAFTGIGRLLGFSGRESRAAFAKGVEAQYTFEETCRDTGKKLLEDIRSRPDEVVIVLFGRPYNAYSSFANKGIPKKFTSRGYTVIPYEMIDYTEEPIDAEHADYMTWEAGQRILRVAQIVKEDSRLFGVFITNFLCGPDSFIVPYFRKIMGTKPSLTLELDEHTADAGINTRIEAFLDIIANHTKISREIQMDHTSRFRPAKIQFEHQGVAYIDSAGKRFKPTHPRVKMLVPHMGTLGGEVFAIAVRRHGIRAEALPPSDNETLHLGRGVTTGKECLPLILIIGSIVKYLKYRDKACEDEKLILFVPKASGHCRFGQYHVYINQYIKENRIKDVALLDLGMEERFTGLSAMFNFHAWRGVIISDVLEDIRYALKVLAKDSEQGMRIYNEEVKKILHALEYEPGRKIYRQLSRTACRLKEIPLKVPYEDAAKIALTGEIFVRQDHFSNLHMADRLADAGFVVVTSPVAEILYYANFMINEKIKEPRYTLTGWLEFIISEKTQTFVEKKIKRILSRSGLVKPELVDVDDLISHSEYFFPRECDGEHGLTVGLAVRDALNEYCAMVHVGPFGCMQSRFADATFIPEADVKRKRAIFRSLGKELDLPGFEDTDRIPFLSIESDGNPSPQMLEVRFESFCLEAGRAAKKLGKVIVKPEKK
jgi:predicted nucleotide-binding protein (sugar kinase/HSP70/actin superfamily)